LALHHLPHRFAQRRGREAAILGRGVAACLERRDDARVGGRAADAQPLELLHQTRLAEPRRWLGEMLVRRDLLDRDDVALRERRDRPGPRASSLPRARGPRDTARGNRRTAPATRWPGTRSGPRPGRSRLWWSRTPPASSATPRTAARSAGTA